MVNQSSHSSNSSDALTHSFAATGETASRPVDLLSVFGDPEKNTAQAPELLAQASRGLPLSGSRQLDVTASLSKLASDARQNMDAAHGTEFMAEVNAFLTVAKQKNLSQEEINRTLDATAQLLEGQGEKPLSATDRAWLATTLMHNLGHPDRVDQGYHMTCNVTAISKVLMVTEPATVAEMISSTALNGYYQASDGKRIAIDAQSLQPDHEATGGQTRDKRRNYANQVFDLIAINNYWQRNNPPYSYMQRQSTGAGDTGERLVNAFGQTVSNRDGSYMNSPNLDCRAMIAIGHELGFKGDFLISSTHSDGAGVRVGSPDQLSQSIMDMLKSGHPAMLFVMEGNKLFTGKHGIKGKGWHVITIDSYDPATRQFHLSNQWGAGNDQMVSAANLYDAMLPESMWASDANYYNDKIFHAYHHQMADGGAGLSNNQVLTGSEFNKFISDQKKQMQEQPNVQSLLQDLKGKLEAARAADDQPEVKRLQDWIDQTKQGLQR